MRKKFEFLSLMFKDTIDILMLSETKLDLSFPPAQFYIDGQAKPYKLDRDQQGGGYMLFVRIRNPYKLLKS